MGGSYCKDLSRRNLVCVRFWRLLKPQFQQVVSKLSTLTTKRWSHSWSHKARKSSLLYSYLKENVRGKMALSWYLWLLQHPYYLLSDWLLIQGLPLRETFKGVCVRLFFVKYSWEMSGRCFQGRSALLVYYSKPFPFNVQLFCLTCLDSCNELKVKSINCIKHKDIAINAIIKKRCSSSQISQCSNAKAQLSPT